jgi:hypothetical protein
LFDAIIKSSGKNYIPYFIKDDRKFIGFITARKSEDNLFIEEVKVFSFYQENDKDVIRVDAPKFIDSLLQKYKKVQWSAHKDNKAVRSYNIYLKKKIRNGYNGTVEPHKKHSDFVQYIITWRD